KKHYSNVMIPIDLSSVTAVNSTQKVYSTGGGGGKDYEKYIDKSEAVVLIPSQAMSEFPIDGIDLTAIGYVDGMLHVQMALNDRLTNDNHGFFYLKDANGKLVDYNYNIYFTNQYEQQENRIDYCEYIFDIPQSELSDYSLYGDFIISGMITEGIWKVTFPLKQAK
ncbi:MAG TPA: hypothetical protein DCM73_03425, partial [Clostridiales bacterium]|nr:hypothetical protein [Clostridiales bacterium]